MQSNQTSSRKNPSTLEAKHPGPRFAAGLCPLLFSMGFNVYVHINICLNPSADKLRVKSGKTDAAGHTTFAKRRPRAAGQFLRPPVLHDLQGKGPVRQRSLSADLIFWYFFIKEKGLGPPAAMSGTMT
jgi:hypothetical protein